MSEPKLKRIGSNGGRPWITYRYGQFKIVQLPEWDSDGGSWAVSTSSYGEGNPWEGRRVFPSLEDATNFAHEQWLLTLPEVKGYDDE